MKLTLDRRHLKAALVIAPKADVRFYLNGVLLEVGAGPAGNMALIVATDGHRLTCSQAGITEHSMPAAQFILPRDLIERVAKHKLPRKALTDVELSIINDDLTFTMPDGATYGGKVVEGRFPDWRRVTRQTKGNGVASGIDPRYYGAMHDYFGTLKDFTVTATLGLPVSVDYLALEAKDAYAVDQCMMATCEGLSAFMVIMPKRDATSVDFGMVRILCERAPVAKEEEQAAAPRCRLSDFDKSAA